MMEVAVYPSCFDICHPTTDSVIDTDININDWSSGNTPKSDFDNNFDVDRILVASFKQLLKMYGSKWDDGAENGFVMVGGLQQYLIKQAQRQEFYVEQPRRKSGTSPTTTFHDIPDCIQLHIFSFLNAKELCIAAQVCQYWHLLNIDNLLWQSRLDIDMQHWETIGHATNPLQYKKQHPEWPNKEIYLRCSPEVQQKLREQYQGFHHLSNLLRSFWPKKTPKTAMFGPGLESSTSGVARKIMGDTSGLFTTTGMFPGNGGVGSGFTIKLAGGAVLNLSTLYTATRKERGKLQGHERLRKNLMLAHHQGAADDDSEEVEEQYDLNPQIKEFCATLDALIFVTDATQDSETLRCGRVELEAMLRETDPSLPLLILSFVPRQEDNRKPCIDIVKHLHLTDVQRPWQVHDCVVEGMQAVVPAMEWLIQQAHRR